jgi:hypothetical protein
MQKEALNGSVFVNHAKTEQKMHISLVQIFEYRNEEYFALGMRDGSLVIKPTGSILNSKTFAHVEPPREPGEDLNDKVTAFSLFDTKSVVFGSKEGKLTFYDMKSQGAEGEVLSFNLQQRVMPKVLKVRTFSDKMPELKKHLYYVLTEGNLFALTKSDNQIQ